MLRLCTLIVGCLCLFGIVAADRIHEIDEQLRDMERRMNDMSEHLREREMSDFKDGLVRSVHRRFVFGQSQRNSLNHHMDEVMGATQNNLQSSVHGLVDGLNRSEAPRANVEGFIRSLQVQLAAPRPAVSSVNPQKTFSIIKTRASHSDSIAACRAKGGNLAVLLNSAEAEKAWQVIASYKSVHYYVDAKSLPERFRRTYPQLLGCETGLSSSPNAECVTMNPEKVNNFLTVTCSARHGALCEKFDLTTPVKKVGVKGFVYYEEAKTLEQAKQTCASIGGSLATIRNSEEQEEAFDHLNFGGDKDAFIDASKGTDEIWRWSGKTEMTYRNWGPITTSLSDRCAVMDPRVSGRWGPVSCTSRHAFLCEVRVIQDSFVRLIDRNAIGKYYVAHKGPLTHYEAKVECQHMATIRDDEQQAAAMLAAKPMDRVHIGLSDNVVGGIFTWDDNTPVDETLLNTHLSGASLRSKDNRCVILDLHGRWQTTSCKEKAGYLCEVPYSKRPVKEESPSATFEMEVRFDIPYAEVTRTRQLKETFIKEAEKAVQHAIGSKTNDILVSGLKSGSTIVTYRFYMMEMDKAFNDVKEAIKGGRLTINFNGRTIRPTPQQDYNYKPFLIICIYPGPESFKHRDIVIGCAVAAVILIIVAAIVLLCWLKKRKAAATRVASTIDVKASDLEKKFPPPDEPLPSYEDAVPPPPYFPHMCSPPPPYAPEMPEVKT